MTYPIVYGHVVFEMLNEKAEWLVNNGSPQDVSMCIWACARLGAKQQQTSKLFLEFESNIDWFMKHGTSKDVSDCIWAYKVLGKRNSKLQGSRRIQ
jgi:hypothetical protein